MYVAYYALCGGAGVLVYTEAALALVCVHCICTCSLLHIHNTFPSLQLYTCVQCRKEAMYNIYTMYDMYKVCVYRKYALGSVHFQLYLRSVCINLWLATGCSCQGPSSGAAYSRMNCTHLNPPFPL